MALQTSGGVVVFLGAHERLLTRMVFQILQASQKWLIFFMFLFTNLQFLAPDDHMPFWGGSSRAVRQVRFYPPDLRNPGGLRSGLRGSLNGGGVYY